MDIGEEGGLRLGSVGMWRSYQHHTDKLYIKPLSQWEAGTLRGPDGDQAISVGLPANAGPSSEIFDPINQNMTLRYQLDGLSIEVLQTVT